jgi:predicted dehydrogenase
VNNNQSEAHVKEQDPNQDRREFLKATTAAAASVVTGFPAILSAQTVTNAIKVGLVGAGGRGTGAAAQALHADDYAELTAVADIDQSRIDASLATLGKEKIASRLKVDKDKQFLGLDAYQKVIDAGVDIVILTTPPGFRPVHLAACIDANKHVFCEKPISTDAPGVRSVLATTEKAKQKNLSLVSGFCWRYNASIEASFAKVHDGSLGRLIAYDATYYTSPVKPMPPESSRPAGVSDTEWQIRNWYNFVWLCGDSLVEQAVHSVDKVAWAMKDEPPVSCVAVGGRQIPAEGGNIFDHFAVTYLYPNGFRAFVANRQNEGCYNENADFIMGSDGQLTLAGSLPPRVTGKNPWTWSGEKYDMYQREHDVLFAAIRKNTPVNNGKRMATSTLLAMMGRMAAYTGQQITWEQAMNSQEALVPEHLDWHGSLPVAPRAQPGITKFF